LYSWTAHTNIVNDLAANSVTGGEYKKPIIFKNPFQETKANCRGGGVFHKQTQVKETLHYCMLQSDAPILKMTFKISLYIEQGYPQRMRL